MRRTNDQLLLSGLQVYTEQGVLQNSNVVIRDNIIQAVHVKNFSSGEILEFPKTHHLVPGFIDLHVHGANNQDVMDGTPEALAVISETLAAEGTTAFLATTMTAEPQQIENALMAVRDFMPAQLGAKILGVHLEGPFISAKKVGAQRADKILTPDKKYIEHWQKKSGNAIKLITLAPELPNGIEFIRYLKKQNIIVSIGHSDATYEESMAGIEAGCSYATHVFNAMRGIHQREPGAVTAALLSEKMTTELIVDGVHLHPAVVQLILKLKTMEKMVLITDAMRAKCLCDGQYELGGQAVEVKQGIASLKDGTLAGSILKMPTAIRNFLHFTHCTLTDAIKMTSENPAKLLGIFKKTGSITANKEADLVVLDDDFNVVLTVCGGRIVYRV